MTFVFLVLIGIVPLRRAGWVLSKKVLYLIPQVLSVVLTMVWASLISYLVHILIRWQDPNIVIKSIFGYGFGSYLSIPNFALFDQSTLPPEEVKRTAYIYVVSLVTFVFGSVILAFPK